MVKLERNDPEDRIAAVDLRDILKLNPKEGHI